MTPTQILRLGFPKMKKEKGEKRDFLPDFFTRFLGDNLSIYLEKGYGSQLGFSEEDYLMANSRIIFSEKDEVFKQQLIVVIRSPEFDDIEKMRPGSGLLAMLHYETRPYLLDLLKKKQIHAFSLDSIVDDNNERLVVSYEMTALGGIHTAFSKLHELHKEKMILSNKPIKVSIIGMGKLGVHAGRISFGQFNEYELGKKGVNGISVQFLEREIMEYPSSVKEILEQTDLLVDATKRPDPTRIIIANDLLGSLPKHAIVLDLTADPYEKRDDGYQVKAIEGIPHGSLDQYIFDVEDSAWNDIPSVVQSQNRRLTISCNAWPGVMAKECMNVYAEKMWPFIKLIGEKGFQMNINSDSSNERALKRATIDFFEEKNQ